METFKKILLSEYKVEFILSILALIGLTFFTFHDVTKMVVSGQGFDYLYNGGAKDVFWNQLPSTLKSFEVSAALLSTFCSKFFGLNFSLYYWVWIITILLIGILLFSLVYVLTKSKLAAFSAALIFNVCYVSQMGLIGWVDTSFVGREPNLLLLIPSFIFLHLFLRQSKLKFYLVSILLFFLGLGLGQFGIILGISYIIYPLFWLFFVRKEKFFSRDLIKKILVSLSFLIVTIFFVFIHSDGQNSQIKLSYTYFFLHPGEYHYLEQIPLQLSNWSNYSTLTSGIYLKNTKNTEMLGYNGSLKDNFTNIRANKDAAHVIAIIYLLAILLIYFQLPEMRPLLLAIIFGTSAMLIENIYIGHYVPEEQPGPSRYLFYPTIWLSIFWSLFLWAIFWKRENKLLMFLGFAILGGYYLVNTNLIQAAINQRLSSDLGISNTYNYVENLRPSLEQNTLIVTPWDEMDSGADRFFNDKIGKGKVIYMPDANNYSPTGGWEKVASSSAHVVKLQYTFSCKCVIENKLK